MNIGYQKYQANCGDQTDWQFVDQAHTVIVANCCETVGVELSNSDTYDFTISTILYEVQRRSYCIMRFFLHHLERLSFEVWPNVPKAGVVHCLDEPVHIVTRFINIQFG